MNVELLAYTGNPGLMVATAARTCYSTQTPREIRTELEGEDVQRILGNTHPSTYEHAVFTFSVTNVSRVLTHQLVRHRMASYSQQSQRYAGIHGQLPIIPESVRSLMAPSDGYDTRVDKAVRDFRNAENILYSELKRAGVPEEDIRYFAPQGTTTNIVVTMNLRELSHFCGLRRCKRAQWEIRNLADRMAEIVEYRCPEIARMGILRRQCGQLGYCPESKGCGMSPTFRQRVHKEALLELEMFRHPGIDEDGAKAEIRSMLDDVGEGEE